MSFRKRNVPVWLGLYTDSIGKAKYAIENIIQKNRFSRFHQNSWHIQYQRINKSWEEYNTKRQYADDRV